MISKIITIDQSTSATKAMLFSESCELLHRVNIEHQQFYPQLGWVEHDAEEIYKNHIPTRIEKCYSVLFIKKSTDYRYL